MEERLKLDKLENLHKFLLLVYLDLKIINKDKILLFKNKNKQIFVYVLKMMDLFNIFLVHKKL